MSFFNQNPQNMQQAVQKLMNNPAAAIREAGVQIPENMMNNPQAMVMHLIQTGQVSNPVLKQMTPFINKLMGK